MLLGTVTFLAFAYFFSLPNTTALIAVNFTISGFSLLASYFLEEASLLYGFWIFLGIGAFVGYNNYLNLSNKLQYFSLVLTTLAIGFYFAATQLWKSKKEFGPRF